MDSSPSQRCPACGSSGLLSVVVITAGTRVTFTICHQCEDRRWTHDDREVPLRSLLPHFRRRWASQAARTT